MRSAAASQTKKCCHSEVFSEKTFDLPQISQFLGKPKPASPPPTVFKEAFMANIHKDTQSDIHSNNAKAKLHMVLGRLLDGVFDDDLQQIQTEVDETETLAVKGGDHHDHPTLE
jgi:hypothetical protein